MASEDDALTVKISCKKLNDWYKKIEAKMKKREKNLLEACNKQYQQRCYKCGKYGRKLGDPKCPENKNEHEKDEKTEKND